jgi:ATP-dependent Clp protease ATP-binding subunit ClpB
MALLDPILKAHFRPEFLNRLDDILPFLPLQKEDMKEIVEIQLKQLQKRLQDRQIVLTFDDATLALLAVEGYDPLFGARPLKRLIQQKVINPLSTAILEGNIPPQSAIELQAKEGEISWTKEKTASAV